MSRYQGSINWTQVAAAGKQFAIVRVGSSNSGGLYVDPYFLQNVTGAHSAGLRVGAYYYTYARTRAAVASELTAFLNMLASSWSTRCSWMWRTQALPAWAAPS